MKAKTKGMMSFGEIRELVNNAICTREGEQFCCYIVDIFTDSVVYESCGKDGVCKYYQCSYSVVDGQVTLGDAVEVEKQVEYVPIRASAMILGAVEGDSTGSRWLARIVEFGPDKNGVNWTRESLTAALPMIDGMKVFALRDAQHQEKAGRFGKSTHELVGAVSKPRIEADGVYGEVVILPSGAWIGNDLKACEENGIRYVYGLSVDIRATTKKVTIAGKTLTEPVKIVSAQVDVVYDPAAGGEFLKQLAAAKEAGQKGDTEMFEKLLAALKGKRPELYAQIQAGIAAGTITQDQALEQIAAATVQDAGGDATNQAIVASVVGELKSLVASAQSTQSSELQQMQLLACSMTLTTTLANSKLPEPVQDKLRASFTGVVFKEESLQAAIKAEKEMLDKLTASGTVQGAGEVRITTGRESVDKLQAAFDGMVGVPLSSENRDVPIFTSLRAAYVEMTGDTEITGVLNPQQLRRMQASYGDTTFAYALGNSLYRRLTNDYREMNDYGVSHVVGNNIRNARDFRTLENIRIGYYGDIPTVDTDAQDYPDLGEVSDERVDYALQERGGIITINRRTIINDDLRTIQRIISRLPRAARRTLAKRVWSPFITNAIYRGDNKAIFHADHGNLGSAAYAIASAEAAKTAMFNQTEPNSGEKLGLVPVCVCFPAELRALVTNVNNFNPQAVAVENGNSMYGFFKPEMLHQNPFQTDANDWMFFADPNEVEIVELAFLNGQQEPQMLVADTPSVGQMFVGNRIQYRITHDYNCEVVDFRGAYKAVVA